MEVLAEDYEEGDEYRCGDLLVSLQRARPAAPNWQRCYAKLLVDSRFQEGPHSILRESMLRGDEHTNATRRHEVEALGRYLSGKPSFVYTYAFQDNLRHITTYADAS